jgi:3-oxoacyl-[acyl-carrier-protein] synthase II
MNRQKTRSADPSSVRVVVTGMGAVTPLGFSAPLLWEALLRGDDAIGPLDRFDPGGIACTRGGQIRGYAPPGTPAPAGTSSLAVAFAAGACAEAVSQAGGGVAGLGIVTASNFGPLDEGERGLAGEAASLPACAQWTAGARLARAFRLPGPVVAVSLSCAAGAAALAEAAELLCAGRAGRLLVVGYDVLSRCAWSGLCALRTMTRERVRPFDLKRSGTIFSEGAAALLLEREDVCARRGGRPLAVLRGWATGNNGFHMTAPPPRAAGSAQAMRQALARAGLPPEAIDHINAHGTGTVVNDVTEAQAIADVFGPRAGSIPVTSVKSGLGHMLGAAGTVEALTAVLTMRHGLIPPTVHHETPDPECPLDVVAGVPRRCEARCVLSNSAGFGGCNAAVVLTLPEKEESGRPGVARPAARARAARPPVSVAVTGLGVVSALGLGREECAAAWREDVPALAAAVRARPPQGFPDLAGEAPEIPLAELLPSSKTYLDRQAELLLAACALALRDGAWRPATESDRVRTGLSLGACWGPLETLARFFDDCLKKGPRLVKPMLFPHSYANAAISLAAMEWELRGPHFQFAGGRDASAQALLAARDLLLRGEADRMLAGGVEALGTTMWAALAAAGRPAAPGEGAAVLLLESEDSARRRGVPAAACLAGGALAGGAPAELGATCREVLRGALDEARLAPGEVRAVFLSACGVDELDAAEREAALAVLGAGVRLLAPAAMHGNVEGASGAMQAADALLAGGALPALILAGDPAGTAAALALA